MARIDLTDEEAVGLVSEISHILEYVTVIQDMAESKGVAPAVDDNYNSLKDDIVTNSPGSFAESLLEAAPERYKQFVKVKKILPN